MQSSVIDKYCSTFSSLKRGSTKFGMAPHKPALLMAFIEMVEKLRVISNWMKVDAELVATYGARQVQLHRPKQVPRHHHFLPHQNGRIDKFILLEPPFNDMHDQGIFDVFEDEVQIFKVISITDGINGNAERVG